MKKLFGRLNPMLLDLAAGCIVYGLLGEALILILGIPLYEGSLWKLILGFFIGIVAALALIVHMYCSVVESLSLGEAGALKHTRKMYLYRILGILVILAFIYLTNFCNAIAFVIGLLSLKVAAYLQPVTHKFLVSKIIK